MFFQLPRNNDELIKMIHINLNRIFLSPLFDLTQFHTPFPKKKKHFIFIKLYTKSKKGISL